MPQKSIAIYSPCGPQATKVNNTVTSSLTAEHGHKTALPLKYNLTQLFIYAGTADCVAFTGDKYFSRATQRGQARGPQPDGMRGPELQRHLDIAQASCFRDVDFMEER